MLSRAIILLSLAGVAFGHSGVTEVAIDADGVADNIDIVAMLQSPITSPKTAAIETDKSQSSDTGEVSAAKVSFTAAFAEYVAMTLFVMIGCGSAMAVAKTEGWVLQVALSFGFAITALAYAIGHYSGGQINCAVTLGLVLTGNCGVIQGLLNFVAQMLGSISGACILRGMFPEAADKTCGLGTNGVSEGWTQLNALIGEFFMTFLLMFVVLETATNPAAKANSALACVAIGFAVFLAHSVLIPIDGCSINPTRSFGPAVVAKLTYKEATPFGDMWVFWVGPLLGATAAAAVSTALMA